LKTTNLGSRCSLAWVITAVICQATLIARAQPEQTATCSELLYDEIAPSQVAEQFLNVGGANAENDRRNFRLPAAATLIAALPDVDRTPAGEAFDGALDALVSGMEKARYIRDHARLQRDGASGPSGKLYRQHCPGIILFRPRPSAGDLSSSGTGKAFVILTVGENWHSGIDRLQFRSALQAVQFEDAPLAILGPYYSASAQGFIHEIDRLTPRLNLIAASGSMSSDAAIEQIQLKQPDLQFRSFTSTQTERRRALYDWRKKTRGEPLADGRQSDVSAVDWWPVYKDPAQARPADFCQATPNCPLTHIAALRLQGTTFGLPDSSNTKFRFDEELVFPGNLVALRIATEASSEGDGSKSSSDAGLAPGDSRKAALEDWELIPWREPKHSAEVFRAGIHEAVSKLPASTDSVWITNERIEDASLLARLLKEEAPDLRVIIDRRDLALLRDDYSQVLHGSLIVSTYSTAEPARTRTENTVQDTHSQLYTLTRDQGFGVFHALQWLLTAPQDRAALERRTGPRLEVIAGGQLIPLTGSVNVEIPPVFFAVIVLFALLALADLVRLSSISSPQLDGVESASQTPTRFLQKVVDLCLHGIQGCTRDTLTLAYAVAFLLARASLALAWVQLTVLGGFALATEDSPEGLDCVVRALFVIVHMVVGGGSIAATVGCALATFSRTLVGAHPIRRRVTFVRRGVWCLLAVMTASVIGAICAAADESAFVARSLQLFGGASPIAVTLLTCLILYSVCAFTARRLRVLDYSCRQSKDPLLGELLFDLACRQDASGKYPTIGYRLYAAAKLPANVGWVTAVAGTLLLVVAGTPPLNAWNPGSFTLEDGPLHWFVTISLVFLAFAIAFLINQSWVVYRRFVELLARLAVSDLFDAFKQVAWPRTVTQHLWVNWPRSVELRGALKLAEISDPDPDKGRSQRDVAYASLFEAIAVYGECMRTEKNSVKVHAQLAGLVTFELANWMRQITTLMTSLTIATTGLLACSSLYVFGVRRLMITVSALLTVGAVVLAMVMFTTLEHDEVLRRIGTGSPGGPDLNPMWQRILTYGVLPLLLLLTTYYPGIWSQLFVWVQAHLPSSKS
jgi:hypothetical protein